MATATPWTRLTPEITTAGDVNGPPLYDYYATSTAHQHRPADNYLYADQAAYLPASGPTQQQGLQSQQHTHKPYGNSIHGSDLHSGAVSYMIEADGRPPAAAYNSGSSSSHAQGNGSSSRNQHHETMLEHWLVPDHHIRYWALWSSVFTLAACFMFAFMAGQYGLYQLSPSYRNYHNAGSGSSSSSSNSTGSIVPLTDTWGPAELQGWLKFWVASPQYSFDVPYLYAYGARYMVAIREGQWWRLFSSLLIHGNFAHLFSNMVTFIILAVPLEHSYGLFRIFIIFLASGFGGTLLSMAFEDPCMLYVGASGAVFGFLGLYIADIVLNWESIYKPLLRLALMLVSLGLTLGIEFATGRTTALQKVSHMSHVGGLVSGMFVSFLFLPNIRDKRWKKAKSFAARIGERFSHAGTPHGVGAPPAAAVSRVSALQRAQSCWRRHAWLYWLVWCISACVVLFFFVGLPVYIWVFQMPSLQCPALLPQQQ